eukprot:scaffold60353_cov15-Tisochrysis_lutea.AAC.1
MYKRHAPLQVLPPPQPSFQGAGPAGAPPHPRPHIRGPPTVTSRAIAGHACGCWVRQRHSRGWGQPVGLSHCCCCLAV